MWGFQQHPCLWPLDANSPLPLGSDTNVSKHCQMPRVAGGVPPIENLTLETLPPQSSGPQRQLIVGTARVVCLLFQLLMLKPTLDQSDQTLWAWTPPSEGGDAPREFRRAAAVETTSGGFVPEEKLEVVVGRD